MPKYQTSKRHTEISKWEVVETTSHVNGKFFTFIEASAPSSAELSFFTLPLSASDF